MPPEGPRRVSQSNLPRRKVKEDAEARWRDSQHPIPSIGRGQVPRLEAHSPAGQVFSGMGFKPSPN
jgi:hypothetical protein